MTTGTRRRAPTITPEEGGQEHPRAGFANNNPDTTQKLCLAVMDRIFMGGILVVTLLLWSFSVQGTAATGIFQVYRRFPFPRGGVARGDISALRSHDRNRHARLLAAADIPLGGLSLATNSGIGIGTPTKWYYVEVDTGSDTFWVNCIYCSQCPRESDLGIELKLYNPKESTSGKSVLCDQEFCYAAYGHVSPNCTTGLYCPYRTRYADGGLTLGFYVTDIVQYNHVIGNGKTQPANANITFGCGCQQSGTLNTTEGAVDGIIGFRQSNVTMLSQLSAAGKTKNIFAHCLDTITGGGIFVIGDVVQPKVITTPMARQSQYYSANLKSIDVEGIALQLPTDIFETTESKGTMFDSGSTLAYLPEVVYKELMHAVFAKHQDISFRDVYGLLCFTFNYSVDRAFPKITFNFEDDATLDVIPQDYLLLYEDNLYCVGFQNNIGNLPESTKNKLILGDLILQNKLVVYNIENQSIGWTEYNCSSSIEIKDEETGAPYTVNAHNISSAWRFQWCKNLILLFVTVVCSCLVS